MSKIYDSGCTIWWLSYQNTCWRFSSAGDRDRVRKREKRCGEQVLTAEHGEILSELVPDWMEEQRLLDALTINHPERPV